MIIVKLQGGLGNQMFQYATARHLACLNNSGLKLDLHWFDRARGSADETPRNLLLSAFNISAAIVNSDEVKAFRQETHGHLSAFLRRLLSLSQRNYVCEKNIAFDPAVLQVRGDIYLDGYWQSDKYFIDIKNILLKEFTLREKLEGKNKEVLAEIDASLSVSIHIRRGDYAANPVQNRYHGVCPLDYYHRAVEYLSSRINKPHFFVFSDDRDWVKKNLTLSAPMTIVENNSDDNAHCDLILMSRCRHHIVANSSFSWWGAWLNNNPDKIDICPSKWFNDPSVDTKDLVPSNWVKL